MLTLAWKAGTPARLTVGFDDDALARRVGVDGVTEFPLCLVSLGSGEGDSVGDGDAITLETLPLSPHERRYEMLEGVHAAGRLGRADVAGWAGERSSGSTVQLDADAHAVIRRRGSARRFGPGSVPLDTLRAILRFGTQGSDVDYALAGLICVFAAVHAVDGLAQGTYVWEDGDLRCLRERDVRMDAAYLCLGQGLGGEGAVTLFLMADLDAALERFGDRGYRVVQLEGGLTLGRLDLAAHAAGFGATGLTFFDDEVTAFFSPPARGLACMVVCAIGERVGRLLPLA